MNVIDIILLICFVPAVIMGLRKGFIAQVIAIISIILGIWLSFQFSAALSGWLGQWIESSETILHVISFAVILIIVILLGWLNRLLGVVFAILKYALVLGLLVMLFDSLNESIHIVRKDVIDGSLLYRPFLSMANSIFPYLKELVS